MVYTWLADSPPFKILLWQPWHWPAFSDNGQLNQMGPFRFNNRQRNCPTLSLSNTLIYMHRRTGWGVSERHSSHRANVINEAHWARLAWDNHSCRVCHYTINSDDRPSLNLWKVMGPGLGAKDINSFVMCYRVLTKEIILKVGYSCVLSQFLNKLFSLLLKPHDQDNEDIYTLDKIA